MGGAAGQPTQGSQMDLSQLGMTHGQPTQVSQMDLSQGTQSGGAGSALAAPSYPLAAVSTDNAAAPPSTTSFSATTQPPPDPVGSSGVPAYQNYGPSPNLAGSPSGTSFGSLQNQAAQSYNHLLGQSSQSGLSGYTDAAIQNYERNILPRIQNQYATIGLGSSPAMADAITAGYYAALPDIYQYQQQGQLGAAQGLSNLAGTTSQHGLGLTGLQNQALANQANFQLGLANNLNARDQTELARQQQAFNNYMTAGNQNYNWMQSFNDARYNDMLRRMGLSQFVINGGFGTPIGAQTSGTQRSGK